MLSCAGFERNGDMDRARQVYDEMQAAGLHFAQPPQSGPLPGESPRFPNHLDHYGRARALRPPA